MQNRCGDGVEIMVIGDVEEGDREGVGLNDGERKEGKMEGLDQVQNRCGDAVMMVIGGVKEGSI